MESIKGRDKYNETQGGTFLSLSLSRLRHNYPKVLFLIIPILIGLIASVFVLTNTNNEAQAAGNTYYVRADGTVTCANKATATSPSNANTSLNMAQVNACTFSAGDQILFSSQGGDYIEKLTLPSGGSGVGSEITYANAPGEGPIIAVSSGYLIDTNSKSNIIIDGLTYNYTGTAVSTNIGLILKAGSNIQFRNINSNMEGYGYNIWSNSALSDIAFDNVNLINGTIGASAISLSGTNNYITVENSILNSGLSITHGANVTVSNSTAGVILNDVTAGSINDIISISSGRFLFLNSSNITISDSSVTGSTSYGASEVSGTSHDITFNRVVANNNLTHGFDVEDTSYNIFYNNCTANNNGNIGFLARESAANIEYRYSEASYNGTVNVTSDGGGFLPHDSATNIKCYYCIAHHNYNQGLGDVGDGTGNVYYNSTNWANGYELGDIFKGSIVTTPSRRSNVYYRKSGGNLIVNNGIFGGGKPREILDTGPLYTTLDYNLYKPVNNSKFYNIDDNDNNISWAVYHQSAEANSNNSNPLFLNESGSYSNPTDYQLTYLSPAIDSGIVIAGITTDYAGNPIYGTPDIGAYEYQPPHTMVTNKIDVGAGARVYGNGKFRDKNTITASEADLSIIPTSGFVAGVYTAWLDITNISWSNTGTHHKSWQESNAIAGLTNTIHTVGDLEANKYYYVTADSSTNNLIGTDCSIIDSNLACKSNSSGKIIFTYTGTYSTHTFDVIEGDNNSPNISGPTVIFNDNSATVSWTTDESSTSRVDYGFTDNYNSMQEDTNMVTEHHVGLTDLMPCHQYHYRVYSKDSSGNDRFSTDNTFTTEGCPAPQDTGSWRYFSGAYATSSSSTSSSTASTSQGIPSSGTMDSSIRFDATNLFPGKSITKYIWDFGDGKTDEGRIVNHKYSSPNRYTVKVTGYDKDGNEYVYEQTIDINPEVPTIKNITSTNDTDLIIEGNGYKGDTIYLSIHSTPINLTSSVDDTGYWSYTINNASETLGEGDHSVTAIDSFKLADNTELKSSPTDDTKFSVTVDNGKLKVEMEKTSRWKTIACVLGGIIVLGAVVYFVRRKQSTR